MSLKRNFLLLSMVLVSLSLMASSVWAENFEQSVAKGKTLYAKNCAACHGAGGEGGIGPALNSKETLDSLGIENIMHTVEAGVPGTAMTAWKGALGEEGVTDVTNFMFAEWAGLVIVGIEMWPWEIAFVVMGSIWALQGLYYVIRV